MTDRRDVPLETTGGWQPAPSGGERILVALAAVALVGGLLIVGGNVLHRDDGVSAASTSPRPTARPSPTDDSTPAPIELSLIPASPPAQQTPDSQFYGWIRANVDLPIMSSTGDVATTLGTLPAGAVAYAGEDQVPSGDRGWLSIQAPEPTGWVATLDAGTELAQRYVPDPYPVTGSISAMAGGPQGFLAIAQRSGQSDNYPATQIFTSRDGIDWQAAIEPPRPGCCWNAVAWGPAGWLLVGSAGGRGGLANPWLWGSSDGLHWDPPGMLAQSATFGEPSALEASDLGYLMVTPYGSHPRLLYSPDGRTWTESDAGQVAGDYLHIAATPIGFLAWIDPAESGTGHRLAAFSPDGRTWSPVSGGPDAASARVVPVGNRVIAMETDTATGALRVWLGSIAGGRFRWGPMTGAAAPFANAVVTTIASDGQQAIAFGWDRATEAPLTWTSDGGPWSRDALAATFDGLPSLAAAGGGGMVVVGHRWNDRGDNPVLWHRSADGSWGSETHPFLGVAPDPTGCGPPPGDAVEFINMNAASAAACFGGLPITFRTWSSVCHGCGGEPDRNYDPTWLVSPTTNALFLSPVKWPDNYLGFAVLEPTLGGFADPSWRNAWLEVTGHYGDPAATTCRWTPPLDQLQYYAGARSIINACRQQFVVTAVKVVDGP